MHTNAKTVKKNHLQDELKIKKQLAISHTEYQKHM